MRRGFVTPCVYMGCVHFQDHMYMQARDRSLDKGHRALSHVRMKAQTSDVLHTGHKALCPPYRFVTTSKRLEVVTKRAFLAKNDARRRAVSKYDAWPVCIPKYDTRPVCLPKYDTRSPCTPKYDSERPHSQKK
eukprot:COSAG02_NODE_247_length_27137_cov_61.275057_5_plen_133_part_00